MKTVNRVLLLTGILVIAVSDLSASYWAYDTCYVTCYDSNGQQVQYVQHGTTSDECCAQVSYICPDKNYPVSVTWSPSEGWPIFCPPQA